MSFLFHGRESLRPSLSSPWVPIPWVALLVLFFALAVLSFVSRAF